MNINTLTMKMFKAMPLVVEGESKEVRYCGNGEVIIRLKPTVYSYTHNRAGVIAGTDTLRLRAIAALLPVLQSAGVRHTYIEANDYWIRSQLVLQPVTTMCPHPFRPSDLSLSELAKLSYAPPVEVVVKKVHGGTPKHRYYQFSEYPTRTGQHIQPDGRYPQPFVRFDWRNPMHDYDGNRLADETLPEPMAEWFINVEAAKQTALVAFAALDEHLASKGLDLWDICFFVTADGQALFGEVSPDGLRVRAADGTSLDKDVWRSGGSSSTVKDKWQAFASAVS